MPEYLAPGVYVEEVDTGNKPIEGVSTSTAGMVGVTERGPVNVPILVTSVGEYTRWFGQTLNVADFTGHCYLPHAVQGFFDNQGSRLYITRIVSEGAAPAITVMFDRGSSASIATTLLRSSSQGTGSLASPPVLYVLDTTGINPNDWVRVGDGSAAEYVQVAATGGAVGTMTHLPVNFPLHFPHDGITVAQINRVLAAAPGVNFTLAADAKAGSTSIVIQGSAADIAALLPLANATPSQLLEIGTAAGGEHHLVLAATAIGTTQLRVTLEAPLAMAFSGATPPTATSASVTRLNLGAPAAQPPAALDVPVRSGDRLVFVATGAITLNALAILGGPADVQREVRRVGALGELNLDSGAYEPYAAGTLVESIALTDDFRTLNGAVAALANQFVLNDVSGLVPGQSLNVDGEGGTIQSIDPGAKGVTLTGPLAMGHLNGAHVTPTTRTLAPAVLGAGVISVGNRLGLSEGDVIHLGTAPSDEYGVIHVMPNRAASGVVPDPGNIVLAYPLSRTYATGVAVVRVVPPATATQQTVTVLNVPMGASSLLVTDDSGYAAGQGARLTTASGGIFYHMLAASTVVTAGPLSLTGAIENAHPIGSVVTGRNQLFEIDALDVGAWGNRLRISVVDEDPGLVSNTTIATIIDPTHLRLASAAGVEAGTILELLNPLKGNAVEGDALKVVSVNRTTNFTITLAAALTAAQQAAETAAVGAGMHLTARSREFRLTVYLLHQPDAALPFRGDLVIDSEVFRWLSMDPRHSRYIEKVIGAINGPKRKSDHRPEGESWYVRVQDLATTLADQEQVRFGPETLLDILPNGSVRPARRRLEKGDDLISSLGDADYIGADASAPEDRTGLQTMRNIDEISLIACPGQLSAVVQDALIAHCELMRYRFAVLDSVRPPDDTLPDVQTQRQQFDSKYAALYYPWLLIPNPYPTNMSVVEDYPIPPVGHMLGIYARVDDTRGVHKAPANEVVLGGIIALERRLNKAEQDILNPLNINVTRDFRPDNRGIRVWGARVVTSDPDWKYVNVRRLLIFIEKSIDRGLQWVVFEPNSEPLWARVRRSISAFLTVVWRNGALEGTKPEEAFYVKCDRTTMTQADIDNGRLIVLIGVAPVKPAEFVIIRIGLWTAHAE